MSEVDYTAPPPPPPPGPPRPAGYDFARPFTFIFDDPEWVPKVLIGGLFFLAAFLIVGVFFLFGYMARLARNVIAGAERPLPAWDDLGEYFREGLLLVGVSLIYTLPIVIVAVAVAVPAAMMGNIDNEQLNNLSGCFLGSIWCVLVPAMFAIMFFLPAAMLMVVTKRRFSAAFEFRELWAFIKNNIGNYLLAIVIYLVARFVAGFGIFLLCIGIVFTEFWAFCATTYAFAEAYRLSGRR
jgi:uncharacterized protein DUF4013